MNMYEIAGVHHVAIGVKDPEKMKSFYKDILGLEAGPGEPLAAPHEIMSGITRGVTPVFAASMLSHIDSGIIVEFIQMVTPLPRPIRRDGRYGDIGVNKITIVVPDVKKLYNELKQGVDFCFSSRSIELPGFGEYNFAYLKDPEGNLIELVSGAGLPMKNKLSEVRSVGIAVTDLERSMAFYRKYAGCDTLFAAPHENYSGLVDEISGGNGTRIRSCILASGRGGGMIELFEVLAPRGRSIPSYTLWGDYGYLQTCLLCKNVPEIAARFEKEGLEFLLRLQSMPDEGVTFTYIRDPDGIPLEFLGFEKNVK
jgi:catechol 2,3-dioxygenase-like lactoylglutathione lyase family enzyme